MNAGRRGARARPTRHAREPVPGGAMHAGRRGAIAVLVLTCALAAACSSDRSADRVTVTVGSKAFTESVILGEALALLAEQGGARSAHRRQLGGTRVVWEALVAGEIDVYAEYTGTIAEEILASETLADEAAMRAALRRRDVEMSASLGFNNTYVIGMLESVAAELGIERVSDLVGHPRLRFGFSNEFMDRADGWPALRASYGLPQTEVVGLDHDLAYRGIESRSIDAIDLYSTDAEIDFYGLRALHDDRRHFPEYRAVLLMRADLADRAPAAVAAMRRLQGAIDAPRMIAMNAGVKLERRSERGVAAEFLTDDLGIETRVERESRWQRLGRNFAGHMWLVTASLLAAIVVAVPLGVFAARHRRAGQLVLGTVGVLQTVPSLALFVFMIPLLGIGAPPAIAALFLYSLLPIVRNTYAGLDSIPTSYIESATALGLDRRQRLRLVELPMASVSILAGIKTSAVINIGTATLAALIGAPGFGQPILTGIRLADNGLIMEGAVPAALLALAAQGVFELAERYIVPQGLRIESGA